MAYTTLLVSVCLFNFFSTKIHLRRLTCNAFQTILVRKKVKKGLRHLCIDEDTYCFGIIRRLGEEIRQGAWLVST